MNSTYCILASDFIAKCKNKQSIKMNNKKSSLLKNKDRYADTKNIKIFFQLFTIIGPLCKTMIEQQSV